MQLHAGWYERAKHDGRTRHVAATTCTCARLRMCKSIADAYANMGLMFMCTYILTYQGKG